MQRKCHLLRVRVLLAAVAVAVVALSLAGAAMSHAVAARPTLVVVILGSGGVTSKPAGISCPGRCTATFAAGTRVLLTPKAKKGSRFLRWGGSCIGIGTCRVKVSALAAVAAQFLGSTKPPPPPTSAAGVGQLHG